MSEVHWYVPGVSHHNPKSLPKAKNISRDFEHISGTSKRDHLAIAYNTVKDLYFRRSSTSLKNYMIIHTQRIVNEKLDAAGFHNFHRLSDNERIDLALTQNLLTISTVTHLHQLQTESNPRALVSIFINFLREIQPSPLYFEPLITLLSSDSKIFPEDEEIRKINRNVVRRI
ncbi:unnamed protein product [Blepharisma stoltei]|uniref:Uncharacterized protein n=1 Tax=Blepharisma stoltei TaxID=1481888 RepID=A0AAU9IKL7_9CILI|nr:unnamed protein product [Blepharisma stoltei]